MKRPRRPCQNSRRPRPALDAQTDGPTARSYASMFARVLTPLPDLLSHTVTAISQFKTPNTLSHCSRFTVRKFIPDTYPDRSRVELSAQQRRGHRTDPGNPGDPSRDDGQLGDHHHEISAPEFLAAGRFSWQRSCDRTFGVDPGLLSGPIESFTPKRRELIPARRSIPRNKSELAQRLHQFQTWRAVRSEPQQVPAFDDLLECANENFRRKFRRISNARCGGSRHNNRGQMPKVFSLRLSRSVHCAHVGGVIAHKTHHPHANHPQHSRADLHAWLPKWKCDFNFYKASCEIMINAQKSRLVIAARRRRAVSHHRDGRDKPGRDVARIGRYDGHCGGMPATLTTSCQSGSSRAMRAFSSAGPPALVSRPAVRSFA
jgi:hypothetical protein